MLPNISINLFIVLIAGIISVAVAGVWFSPILFGKQWKKLSGVKKNNISGWQKYLMGLLGALILCYVLAYFIKLGGLVSWSEGVKAGLILWLGFIVPVSLERVLWEGKSVKLYVINIGYWLVSVCIAGAVLAVWA